MNDLIKQQIENWKQGNSAQTLYDIKEQETQDVDNSNKSEFHTVERPQHYASSKIETIDYIKDKLTPEQFEGFLIGNVLKYISRYRLKNGIEDLQKAKWYLEKAIEVLK